jgi:hypothetical protein
LLGNDGEISNYKTYAAGQLLSSVRLNKHKRNMADQQGNAIFCAVRADYKQHKSAKENVPNASGYIWATLFLEEINTGTCPSKLGESQQ